jgi:hypothetical protein
VRRAAIGTLAALLWLLAHVATASAGAEQESIFMDDDRLIHSTPHSIDRTMALLADMGVDRVRLSVIWANIAPEEEAPDDPTDPAEYDPGRLDPLDVAVTTARRHGIEVLLNVRGGAPEWGRPREPPARWAAKDGYRPYARGFGRFVEMIGRRYDGLYRDENHGGALLPRVDTWSIWNEPNWQTYLQPQSVPTADGGLRPAAPSAYRRIFRAAWKGLRDSGHSADTILLGETAPRGTSTPRGPGESLTPGVFLRHLFCLDRRLRPLRGAAARTEGCDFDDEGPLFATGYAHHPYPVKLAPDARDPARDNIRLGDSRRLERILNAAWRHGRLPGRLPLWWTEFGYQTRPDPYRGIPLERQAAWLTRAEWLTWRDERVAGLTQFLLDDSGPSATSDPGDPHRWSTFQTGLRFRDGEPKPAFHNYRLPLLALDPVVPGEPVDFWGLVRGGPDGEVLTVRLEFRPDETAAWQPVETFEVTDPKGYFTVGVDAAEDGEYRVQWLRDPEALASASAVANR